MKNNKKNPIVIPSSRRAPRITSVYKIQEECGVCGLLNGCNCRGRLTIEECDIVDNILNQALNEGMEFIKKSRVKKNYE